MMIAGLVSCPVLMAGGETDFEKIDRHARQAPASAEKSLDTLGNYLASAAENDLERARAIFIWMTSRLRYHYNYSDRQRVSESPEDVLKSRSAVCSGFSNLFVELAKRAGLEAVVINGLAKGYGYRVGEPLNRRSRHSWNGVKIGGQWRLLDTTWGAGYINGENRYVRSFNDFYFMPPPADLVFSHFPRDSRWQLLKRPLTRWEFERRLSLKSYFFKYTFPLPENPDGMLTVETGGTFQLKAPAGMAIQAKLLPVRRQSKGLDMMVQYTGGGVDIRIAAQDSGDYILRVFGRPPNGQEAFDWILDARIRLESADPAWTRFPEIYRGYHETGARLLHPVEGVLSADSTVPFRLKVPGALKVMVKSLKKWKLLRKKGDWFEGKVRIRQSPVQVFAALKSPTHFSLLLEYEVK